MGVLADWFTDDVRNHVDSWREWLDDRSESAEATESNATWLEKDWLDDGACVVTFGRTIDLIIAPKNKIYVRKEDDIVKLPKANVIELLDTWERLLKTCPEQIMIIEENGVYKMFEGQ